jgi:hypothetical protein
MKLACGVGRRVQSVRGSPRCRLDGVGGAKFTEAVSSISAAQERNLSRRSWERPAAGVDVYTFVRWQRARRIFWGCIPAFFNKNNDLSVQ